MANIILHSQQCNSFDKSKELCEIYQEKAYANSIACFKFEKIIVQKITDAQFKIATVKNSNVQHSDSTIIPTYKSCKCGLIFYNKSFSRPFSQKDSFGHVEHRLWVKILH